MAADKWQWEFPEETSGSRAKAYGTLTMDGTGTETPFLFATQNLPNASNTNYHVLLSAYGAVTEPVRVKAATKATTGFTIQHEDGLDVDVSYLVLGYIPDQD